MKRFGPCIMIALLIAGALGLAAPASAGAQGNSEAAQACQKGGWAALAPAESPTTAFQNQDECVSYGASGGVPVALVIFNPSITVTMAPAGNFCAPSVSATGFAPNTTYDFSGYLFSGGSERELQRGEVTTDSTGALSFGGPSFVRVSDVTYRVVIGGFSSAATTYLC